MKPGSLIQTSCSGALRLHRKDPFGRAYSSPVQRYASTFFFYPHEVGLLLEETEVRLDSNSDEFEDLMLLKILTQNGVGYISTNCRTIPRYLKIAA